MEQDNLQISAWIDQYLLETLSEEEMVAFKIKMEADSAIAEEVQLRRGLMSMLQKEAQLSSFRAMQEDIEREIDTPAPSVPPAPSLRERFIRFAPAAAAAVLLLFNGFLWYELSGAKGEIVELRDALEIESFKGEMTEEKLSEEKNPQSSSPSPGRSFSRKFNKLQKNYNALEDRLVVLENELQDSRDAQKLAQTKLERLADQYLNNISGVINYGTIEEGDPGKQALFKKATQDFNMRDYNTALENFEKINSGTNEYAALLFPLGVCYMKGDVEKSIDLLERAYKHNEINREQWHLALAYLRMGNLEKTRTNLEEIIASTSREDPEYRESAAQLLEELDSI